MSSLKDTPTAPSSKKFIKKPARKIVGDLTIEHLKAIQVKDLAKAKYPIELDLSGEEFFELSGLSGLKIVNPSALKELELSHNQLDVLDDIAQFNVLKRLRAASNLLDIAILHFPKLVDLDLSDNQLTSIPDLSSCPNLQSLFLNSNLISGDFNELLKAPKLVHIGLAYNDFNFSETVFLDYVQVFKELKKLYALALEGNPFIAHCTGYRITVLQNCPKLQSLDNAMFSKEEKAVVDGIRSRQGSSRSVRSRLSQKSFKKWLSQTRSGRKESSVVSDSSPRDLDDFVRESITVPLIVEQCLHYIENIGVEELGILREDGDQDAVLELYGKYDTGQEVDLNKVSDVHVVAGTLKLYLHQQPEPLTTFLLYRDFVSASELSPPELVDALTNLVNHLPPVNYMVLKRLCKALHIVSTYWERNQMTVQDLSLSLCQAVFRSENVDETTDFEETTKLLKVFQCMIEAQETIFAVYAPVMLASVRPASISAAEMIQGPVESVRSPESSAASPKPEMSPHSDDSLSMQSPASPVSLTMEREVPRVEDGAKLEEDLEAEVAEMRELIRLGSAMPIADEEREEGLVPEKPTGPMEPMEPVEPVEPVEFVEPTKSTEPTEAVKPVAPVAPVAPVEPVEPVEPVKSPDTMKPADPANPVYPSGIAPLATPKPDPTPRIMVSPHKADVVESVPVPPRPHSPDEIPQVALEEMSRLRRELAKQMRQTEDAATENQRLQAIIDEQASLLRPYDGDDLGNDIDTYKKDIMIWKGKAEKLALETVVYVAKAEKLEYENKVYKNQTEELKKQLKDMESKHEAAMRAEMQKVVDLEQELVHLRLEAGGAEGPVERMRQKLRRLTYLLRVVKTKITDTNILAMVDREQLEQNEEDQQKADDDMQKAFFATCLAVKARLMEMDQLRNCPIQTLYDMARSKVPVNDWPMFIMRNLSKDPDLIKHADKSILALDASNVHSMFSRWSHKQSAPVPRRERSAQGFSSPVEFRSE